MRASRTGILAIALLAIHALLLAGLERLPAEARVVLAAVVLLLSPGLAWLRLLRAGPPGGAWLAPAWALGMGVAWNAVLLSVCALARVPFTALTAASLPLNAMLWLAAWRAAVANPGSEGAARGERSLSGVALALTLLAAAAAAAHALRLGAPLLYVSDSPDHIGTIRRMLEHGQLFPSDAFFRAAGSAGVDPRKFLWHGDVALVVRLARVSPLEAWRTLPALLSPLLVLNMAALGMLLSGPAGAAVSAWVLLLTYGHSLASTVLRETVYAAKLADQLALATSVAVLADLARPSRPARLAAAVLAAAAASVHVFAAFQLALVIGALACGLWLRDRAIREPLTRLVGTALACALAVLPFALWQVLRTPTPVNPIHTDPQGLLWLWSGARVVSPGVIWEWMGPAFILIPLLLIGLRRELRESAAALWLLTTTLAATAVLFVPPVVDLLRPRLGYLLMRAVWMTPLAAVAGWGLPRLAAQLRGSPRERLSAALMLAVSALALMPAARDALDTALHGGRIEASEYGRSALPWRSELEWFDSHFPAGSVVLADPVTSYAVPMLSSGHVVTLMDQHSSPSDPHALERLVDARDALDPQGEWSRAAAVVKRYGVDAIMLNDRFREVPPLDYWTPRHGWFVAGRARFDAHPEAFERVLDHGDFVIYRPNGAALDALARGWTERQGVRPYRPGIDPIAHRLGSGSPMVLDLWLAPRLAAPGDSVRGVLRWECERRLPVGSYVVALRFDRALPGGLFPPAWIAKPVRKVIEKFQRERYRFRDDHLPVGGDFGVDLWPPGMVVRDSFTVVVPRDVAAGDYRVGVRMVHQPHYPNLRLSDYFFEEDSFAGLVVGAFRVSPPPGGASNPPRGSR